MNCEKCKWYKTCAVRQLCLPISYCQYEEVYEYPYEKKEEPNGT